MNKSDNIKKTSIFYSYLDTGKTTYKFQMNQHKTLQWDFAQLKFIKSFNLSSCSNKNHIESDTLMKCIQVHV